MWRQSTAACVILAIPDNRIIYGPGDQAQAYLFRRRISPAAAACAFICVRLCIYFYTNYA